MDFLQISLKFLTETAKWGKFLSIVGFVFTGIIVIASLFIMFSGNSFTYRAGLSFGTGLIYLLMSAFYFFPSFYLFKFSKEMLVSIKMKNERSTDDAFENLKSCFKFMGITTIVVVGIYALILLFALFTGIAGGI